MIRHYTFVAPERQNELTRRIQQKLAAAGKKTDKREPAPEIPPPAALSTPDAPRSLVETLPVIAVLSSQAS